MLYNIRTNWGVKMEGLSMRRPPLEYSMDTEWNMLTRRDDLILTIIFLLGIQSDFPTCVSIGYVFLKSIKADNIYYI